MVWDVFSSTYIRDDNENFFFDKYLNFRVSVWAVSLRNDICREIQQRGPIFNHVMFVDESTLPTPSGL